MAAPEVVLSETELSEPFEIIDDGFESSSTEYPIDLMTAMRLAGGKPFTDCSRDGTNP